MNSFDRFIDSLNNDSLRGLQIDFSWVSNDPTHWRNDIGIPLRDEMRRRRMI